MLTMNIEFLATMGANKHVFPAGLDSVFLVLDFLNVVRPCGLLTLAEVFHITATMRAVFVWEK